MATLSSNDIDDLWQQLMSEFSSIWLPTPFNKNQFRTGLVNIDEALESAEVTILQDIGDADVRAWLQTNQSIGRLAIEQVERKRKEAL